MTRSALLIALLALLAAPGLAQAPSRSPGPPIDQGPTTPDANAAHRGGGVVLEGPPGAAAPPVMQTAPRDILVAPSGSVVTRGETPRSTGVPVQPAPR